MEKTVNHRTEISKSIIQKLMGYFWLFFVGAFLGWIYEVLVFAIEHKRGFVNRGFLFGPYLPVYGFGSLIAFFLFYSLKNKKLKIGKFPVSFILCFVCSTVVATVLELVTSYLMEWTTGSWLWNYSKRAINFEGRIALETSLRFGVLSVLFLYVVAPLLEKAVPFCKKHEKAYLLVTAMLFLVILVDAIVHITAL